MKVNKQLRLVKGRKKGYVMADVQVVSLGESLLKGKIKGFRTVGNTVMVLTTDEQNPIINLGDLYVPPAPRQVSPVETKRKAGRPPKKIQPQESVSQEQVTEQAA